jgi:pyruvate dehydrogenase E1 component alpha subunit
VGEAVARARAGDGPSLIEARTWRWRGHWAGDDQSYREQAVEPSDVEDPLDLYAYRLLSTGVTDLSELQRLHSRVEEEVRAAMDRAAAAPDAGADQLGQEDVYA